MDQTLHTEPGSQSPAEQVSSRRFFRPQVDIAESSETIVIYADVPGASAEEISINFEDSRLEIHAPVKSRHPAATRCLTRQYGVGNYRRVFEIHERIDSTKISAEYLNGVLVVTLPKAAESKPRRISVKGHA